MPKIFLTQKQREDERDRRILKAIGERLLCAIHREGASFKDYSERMGMSHATLAKILRGEPVKISTKKWLEILAFAGIKLVAAPDELEKNSREMGGHSKSL